jgi:two-component system response regulator DctR
MSSIRVLIVEDDPMVADINKSYTEAVKGFTVVGVARNGDEALTFIAQNPPDLVILDVFMPEVNGVEVLSQIRNEDRPIDVIMITAADDTATVSKVLRKGVVAYIEKPFKFERYRSVLERYRRYRETLGQKSTIGQDEIDSLLHVRERAEEREMPKNFHAQTLSLIVNYLGSQDKLLSAEEVAAGVGISRVTSRRYLEYLTSQGQVQMELDYISVGRPIHRFRLVGGKAGER